jgi:hypothetical protein
MLEGDGGFATARWREPASSDRLSVHRSESQPAIPRRVAPQQSPLPLHQSPTIVAQSRPARQSRRTVGLHLIGDFGEVDPINDDENCRQAVLNTYKAAMKTSSLHNRTPFDAAVGAYLARNPDVSMKAARRAIALSRLRKLQRAALAGSGAIYSMTRSASSSNEFGICMPICCAACRLITSSKRVGSSTGRVAGSAPLAILST